MASASLKCVVHPPTPPVDTPTSSRVSSPRISLKDKGASKAAADRRDRARRKSSIHFDCGEVTHKFMPDATDEKNGWQLEHASLKARINAMFNSYTMSDVVIECEEKRIPAHRFVLASASSVFHDLLYHRNGAQQRLPDADEIDGDEDASEMLLRQARPLRSSIRIQSVPHLALFEFLQFIYTDDVSVTLDNVIHLIFLAGTYRVAGITSRCLDFLRGTVAPKTVLRVIKILETLMLKLCLAAWRAQIDISKRQKTLSELTFRERRIVQGDADNHGADSHVNSRPNSRANSKPGSRANSRPGSNTSSRSSSDGSGIYSDDDTTMQSEDENQDDVDDDDDTFYGIMAEADMKEFFSEVTTNCWRCIREQTEDVLRSPAMMHQDISRVRAILDLEECSAREIVFFRMVNSWAEVRCRKLRLEPTAKNKREVLGDSILCMLRYPAMSADEFQWEVVSSGLLEYTDVEPVVNNFSSGRTIMLTRFEATPRMQFKRTNAKSFSEVLMNMMTSDENPSADTPKVPVPAEPKKARRPAESQAPRFSYRPVSTDAVDCLLAAALWRDYHGQLNQEMVDVASFMACRLPSMGGADGDKNRDLKLSSLDRNREQRSPTPMLLGGQGLSPTPSEETTRPGTSSERTSPGLSTGFLNFERIGPGLYRFRGRDLVEIWINAFADAVVCNHGPSMRLETSLENLRDMGADPAQQRVALGLPLNPPLRGGIPLLAFVRGDLVGYGEAEAEA